MREAFCYSSAINGFAIQFFTALSFDLMVPVQSLSVHKLCEPDIPTELRTQLQREEQIRLRERYGDILSMFYQKQYSIKPNG